MTTLPVKNIVQINARTFRTEKYTNKQYNSTFRHANNNFFYECLGIARLHQYIQDIISK